MTDKNSAKSAATTRPATWRPAARGTLTLDLLSDTCFSQPSTDDLSVDTEVAADRLGLPQISGKTLHGLLRDAWEVSCMALDPERKAGETLLGIPRSNGAAGALRIGDAGMKEDVRAFVAWARAGWPEENSSGVPENALTLESVREAFLATRVLTAEDRQEGRPMTDTLRQIRVIPAGTVLFAPVEIVMAQNPSDDDSRAGVPELKLLFESLAGLVRHVGLHRNRGMGFARLTVDWETDMGQDESNEETDGAQSGANSDTPPAPPERETRFLPVALTLTAPCLIGGRDQDPNSWLTRDFIPGSALRGAVAAALAREGVSDAELREILTSGAVRFLNLYPDVSGRRALPTPNTWERVKNAMHEDYAPEAEAREALLKRIPLSPIPEKEDEQATADDGEPKQWQPLAEAFWAREGSRYRAARVAKRSTTHQQRDSQTGSTIKDGDATVFVYEALEAGQTFRGGLAFSSAHSDLMEYVVRVLRHAPLRMGRSLRAGYGGAPTVRIPDALSSAAAVEDGPYLREKNRIRAGSLFTARLTSDAILRDQETGQIDPFQLEAQVAILFDEVLGEGVAQTLGISIRTGVARGYNRLWRTTLPAVPCAAAGSVVLLRAGHDISRDEAAKVQARPLGERVAEGFGCFILASDTLNGESEDDEYALPPLTLAEPHSATIIKPSGNAPVEIREAQERLYRTLLRRLAARQAVTMAKRSNIKNLPSVSLLQRLRVPLRDAVGGEDNAGSGESEAAGQGWQKTWGDWLAETPTQEKTRPLPREQKDALKRARLGDDSLWSWLKNMTEKEWFALTLGKTIGIGSEWERRRFLEREAAEEVWNKEKQSLDLARYYADALLSQLARRARTEADNSRSGQEDREKNADVGQ